MAARTTTCTAAHQTSGSEALTFLTLTAPSVETRDPPGTKTRTTTLTDLPEEILQPLLLMAISTSPAGESQAEGSASRTITALLAASHHTRASMSWALATRAGAMTSLLERGSEHKDAQVLQKTQWRTFAEWKTLIRVDSLFRHEDGTSLRSSTCYTQDAAGKLVSGPDLARREDAMRALLEKREREHDEARRAAQPGDSWSGHAMLEGEQRSFRAFEQARMQHLADVELMLAEW